MAKNANTEKPSGSPGRTSSSGRKLASGGREETPGRKIKTGGGRKDEPSTSRGGDRSSAKENRN